MCEERVCARVSVCASEGAGVSLSMCGERRRSRSWRGGAEYILRNAGLEEAQAGIKIARRNINNVRYADDTTLMAKSEEELKSFLIKVKENGRVGFTS